MRSLGLRIRHLSVCGQSRPVPCCDPSLAKAYRASLTATGSRFALNANAPCAFVLSEAGRVRYVSRSRELRELKGWIGFGVPVSGDSVAGRLIRDGSKTEDYGEIAADCGSRAASRIGPTSRRSRSCSGSGHSVFRCFGSRRGSRPCGSPWQTTRGRFCFRSSTESCPGRPGAGAVRVSRNGV